METEARAIRAEYKNKKRFAKKAYRTEKRGIKAAYRFEMAEYLKDETSDPQNPPRRSVLEETGNAVTHGVGAALSVAALVFMLIAAKSAVEYFSAVVYFVGLFFSFGTSCLYHSFRFGSRVKRLFRRFDYLSIYLLIGATYTPILLCFLGGVYGAVFCALQWAIIAAGVTFIAVFGPVRFRKLHFALYILLGWSALLFLPKMISGNLPLFIAIFAGGVIYSAGIIPFAIKRKTAHFLWHFFVLFGAAAQWIGIYSFIFLRP